MCPQNFSQKTSFMQQNQTLNNFQFPPSAHPKLVWGPNSQNCTRSEPTKEAQADHVIGHRNVHNERQHQTQNEINFVFHVGWFRSINMRNFALIFWVFKNGGKPLKPRAARPNQSTNNFVICYLVTTQQYCASAQQSKITDRLNTKGPAGITGGAWVWIWCKVLFGHFVHALLRPNGQFELLPFSGHRA